MQKSLNDIINNTFVEIVKNSIKKKNWKFRILKKKIHTQISKPSKRAP